MESARLFLAFDLDGPVLDRLEELIGRLKRPLPRARWCRRDALHLTVKFFGTIPLACVPGIGAAVCRTLAAHTCIESEIRGLGGFPSLDAPRVLWAGVGNGAAQITALAGELLMELELEGFSGDDHAFTPHVTLARLGSRDRGVRAALSATVPGCEDMAFGTSMMDRLTLYASTLTPRGPAYSVIERWDVGRAT